MWTVENRGRYNRSRLRYPSDFTDAEWSLTKPLIPRAKRGGNKRTVSVREVVNGLDVCAEHRVPVGRDPQGPAAAQHGQLLLQALGVRRHAGPAAPRALRRLPRAGRARSEPDCGHYRQSECQERGKKRLSWPSRVVSLSYDLMWDPTPQGWRAAPPPSAASALTRRAPHQSGFSSV